MPRFLKWDFDADEVIEYERIGECNGCAQCCVAEIAYRIAGHRNDEGQTFLYNAGTMGDSCERQGVWSEYSDSEQRRFISIKEINFNHEPCKMLVDKKCAIHERKSLQELPLCKTWPIIPEHVEPFKDCSYSFKEIGRWKISDCQKQDE